MMLFLYYYSEQQVLQPYDALSGLSQAPALGLPEPPGTPSILSVGGVALYRTLSQHFVWVALA